jgi:hypothetical protein
MSIPIDKIILIMYFKYIFIIYIKYTPLGGIYIIYIYIYIYTLVSIINIT